MKIAVLTHLNYAIAEPYAGGLEAHTSLMVRELLNLGHEVDVFTRADSSIDGATIRPIVSKRFRYIRPSTNLAKHSFHLLVLLRIDIAMKAALLQIDRDGDYDLIINNSLSRYPLEHASSSPMVTIFHTPPLENMIVGLRHPHASLRNKSYISISHTTQNAWRPYKSSELVLNGIDLGAWHPAGHNKKQNYWFWFGRIVPEKGLDVAIEAASMSNTVLRFAGPIGDPDYFNDKINPYINRNSCIYLGHLDQSQIKPFISHAKLTLVTPQWEEPFGLVLAESLAAGTPVAAINKGAMSELLTSEVGAIAEDNTAASLAKAAIRAENIDGADCIAYARKWSAKRMVREYMRIGHRDVFIDTALRLKEARVS